MVALWISQIFQPVLFYEVVSLIEIWKACDALTVVGKSFSFLSIGAASYVMYLKVKAKQENESLVRESTAMFILSCK